MKKAISFFMAVLMILGSFGALGLNQMTVFAADSELSGTIHIHSLGNGPKIINHNGSPMGPASYDHVVYEKDGKTWPAYCYEPNHPGADTSGYDVNVSGELNNAEVRAAIANSYPFVKLSDLGVKTEHEAYIITKMVIRTIMGGSNYAESTFSAAQGYDYVYDAYKQLLQKAKSGDVMQSQSLESIETKKENLGGNQVHTFTVKQGSSEFKGEYTVTIESGAPTGTSIQNKNGSTFQVVVPVDTLPDDAQGTFNLKITATGETGSVVVFDGVPTSNPDEYQNYALTYSQELSGIGVVNYKKESPQKGSGALRILKRAAGTLTPLSGATFRLNKLDGDDAGVIGDFVTDSKGEIIFNDLTPGAYSVQEITAPKGYLLDITNMKNVTISAANQTQQDVTFDNEKTPKVRVKKVGPTGEVIAGAAFKISLDGGSESYTGTTDSKGEIIFGSVVDLKPGTYKVEEIAVPLPYILDTTPQWVKLEPGKDSEVVFKNHKKIKWRLWKYEKGTSIPIDGAQFSIKNLDTNTIVWEGLVEKGFHELDSLDTGWYRISEIAPPYGYVMEWMDEFGNLHKDHYKDIKLEADKEIDVKFDNVKRPEIELCKVDDKGNPVAGAIFQFKKADGETIFEKTTDKDGNIIIAYDDPQIQLSEGVYEVKETKAPFGYIMDKTCIQNVTLVNGERKILTFVNTKKPTLTLIKLDEETKLPLEGAKFKIIQTENKTIKESITDKDGKIVLTDLDDVIYSIEEIVAPAGYILEPQHKDVKLKPGESMELVFTNKAKPKLRIQKVDANTGELLKNAEFTVTKVQDKTVSNYILENGEIILSNLDEGIYEAHEFMPPDGYVIVKDTLQIATEWGKTKTLKFDNIRKPVIIFQKTNALTGKGIPNTKFKVEYEMPGGGVKNLGSFTTDSNGKIIIPKGEPGYYIFTETLPAPGFSLPKNPVTRLYFAPGDNAYLADFAKYYTAGTGNYVSGYAPSDGTTTGGTTTDTVQPQETATTGTNTPSGSTVTPASAEAHYGGEYYTEGEGFNWPLNAIVLKKADANTGQLLAGAAFELYRADEQVSGQPGTQIGRYTTDASGVVVIVGLEPGYYVAKEVQPPPNYILAETSLQNGFLKADGTSILEMTFRNYPYGSLLVTKVDALTGKPLSNARFKVTDGTGAATGNTNGEFATNTNGEFLVENLMPGTYVVTVRP